MIDLTFAKCCGNCVHSSRPKKPEDHAAHYDVAKTERWCYKHNCYITRETVCDEFEQDNKKGGVPAAKRILKFNQKLQKYNELRDKAKELGVVEIQGSEHIYVLRDNKWYYKYHGWRWEGSYWAIRCKNRDAEEQLNEIEKKLNEIGVVL